MNKIFHYLIKPRLFLAFLLRQPFIAKHIPDEKYVRWNYRLSMGEKLNLHDPVTFREKIQWLKLYNRKPEYTTMVDKLAVKTYVANKIGNEFVIPTIAVFNTVNDIDITSLPDRFVIKSTNGGGCNGVILCTDKSVFNLSKAKKQLSASLNFDIYMAYREWPYKDVERKIFVEQFMTDGVTDDLKDYKFFCFNGVPQFVQVIQNRRTHETIDFFDSDWTHQEFVGLNPSCENADVPPEKPSNFECMLEIAKILSKDIPFVRIDLYDIKGHVYFGEITFFPNSGEGAFKPLKYDRILGDMIVLPQV